MTKNAQEDYESTIINYLMQRQFIIETGSTPGDYIVTADGDKELPLRPRLSLENQILSEYLSTMSADYLDKPDPLFEALSLTEIHIEEELATVDLDGQNYATALGVRRDSKGKAEWFAERSEPDLLAERLQPSEHLVWQADPPEEQAPDHDFENRPGVE